MRLAEERAWRLRLKPVTPFKAAGIRIEPPVSEPIEISLVPSAIEIPAPIDEPPATREESMALPAVG